MAHSYYHARSAARKFGGIWQDYMKLEEFMDHTKAHIPDARHRLLLHNSWGIFFVEKIFGPVWTRLSDGKQVPTRTILEQHVLEDLRCIPTLEQCFAHVPLDQEWYRQALPLSQQLEDWITVRNFCAQVYGELAARVEIETHGEYNDEGGTNYYIESLTAYDAEGDKLSFDFSLPFWQQKCFADLKEMDDKYEEQENAELALREWYGDKESDQLWVTWDELPCSECDTEYDLTIEPTISFPVIFAGDQEAVR
jgi:hypothetical protein